MADTTFTDGATLVVSAWLQDLNNVYYRLTANRVPYATGTALTTSANFTFDGTTLTAHTLTVSTGALTVSLATDATSISTGAAIVAGGLGLTKALWVGGLANIAGAVTLQSTLAVTGNTTLKSYTAWGATGTEGAIRTDDANVFHFQMPSSGLSIFNSANNASRFSITDAGAVTIPGTLALTATASPTGAGTGAVGQIAWDTAYLYICTATNDWRRIALVDF